MGLFDRFTKKNHNTPIYQEHRTAFQVIGDYFGFGNGSHEMHKLIEAYAHNPLVFTIINKISEVCAGLDRNLMDKNKEVESGEVFDLLKGLDLKSIFTQLEATGNVFVRLIKGIGAGSELEVWNSRDVEILLNSSCEVKAYKYTFGKFTITVPKEEILHIKFANVVHTDQNKMHYGYSILEAGMKIVTASTEIFNAESAIFKNRGVVGMLTNSTDQPILESERKGIQESFQEKAGGSDNFNKVLVTTSNLKYIQMGMSPNDLKLIDNQLSKLQFLCGLFGIDSRIVGDASKSAFNNVETAQKSAYTDTYLPLSKFVDNSLIGFLNENFGTDYTYSVDKTQIEVLKENMTIEQLIIQRANTEELSIDELRALQSGVNIGTNE